MPVDRNYSRLIFEKLNRQLTKLAKKPAPGSVHKFRTTGRRAEALLDELVLHPSRNSKKLLKLLARLRKNAGRVRDLDVQIGLLRSLKIPEGARHKAQLLQALAEERTRKEKKMEAAFKPDVVRELRKRLKRAMREIEVPDGEPLAQATRLLAKLGRDSGPLTEKVLHRYRIVGKRARYLAESAGQDHPEAARMVEQLKRMQDVIGDWHDWWKLNQRAEELFGPAQGSPLAAALRNVTRAKFRQAVNALMETRAALSARKPAAAETSAHKAAGAAQVSAAAVA
jgi:CHAD domain-containing protein